MTESVRVALPLDVARWLQDRAADEIRERFDSMRDRDRLAEVAERGEDAKAAIEGMAQGAAIWAQIEFAIRNALRPVDMAALQLTYGIGSRHSVKGVEYTVTAFDRDRGLVVMKDEDGWELHIGAATDAAARF